MLNDPFIPLLLDRYLRTIAHDSVGAMDWAENFLASAADALDSRWGYASECKRAWYGKQAIRLARVVQRAIVNGRGRENGAALRGHDVEVRECMDGDAPARLAGSALAMLLAIARGESCEAAFMRASLTEIEMSEGDVDEQARFLHLLRASWRNALLREFWATPEGKEVAASPGRLLAFHELAERFDVRDTVGAWKVAATVIGDRRAA